MGTETGCTTSIFPSDDITYKFLKAQGREKDFRPLEADKDAVYDEIIEINLSEIEPMAALPHSPGLVKRVREIGPVKVDQVAIGSCTNSSLRDLKIAAKALDNKTVSENLHVFISPGSRQVVEHLIDEGDYTRLVRAGVRIMENACGPCIGMGCAPASGSVSVRTFNRNFEGRSGTKDAKVYLVSPETAAATAIKGVLTDPRDLGDYPSFELPDNFIINDNMIVKPMSEEEAKKVEIVRGPNIKPLPSFDPISDTLEGNVLIKVGDNITTDHIMPAGAKSCLSEAIYLKYLNMCLRQLILSFMKSQRKQRRIYYWR